MRPCSSITPRWRMRRSLKILRVWYRVELRGTVMRGKVATSPALQLRDSWPIRRSTSRPVRMPRWPLCSTMAASLRASRRRCTASATGMLPGTCRGALFSTEPTSRMCT